jgi:hypothetical protein
MLVERKEYKNDDKTIGYYESIYNSSNVLKTTYFPHNNRLYVSFNRGGTYSYENVNEDLYLEFENAESQGKFLREKIIKKPDEFPYRKEFTLYPQEIKDLKLIVEQNKIKENE